MPNSCSAARIPGYRNHKASGQAVVTLNGRDVYLGQYGSPASHEAYRLEIRNWLSGVEGPAFQSQPAAHVTEAPQAITTVEVIAAYLRFAKTYYRKDGKPTNEVRMIIAALTLVRSTYGRAPAHSFGPKALKDVRAAMIKKDWCRPHINKQVDRIKRMFKWAASEELISGRVYNDLRCVTGLKRGRSDAREGKKVLPVSNADFEATLLHLPPVVQDMVKLQRATGARPSEVCDLRPGDINREDAIWQYVPQSHKSEHHDRERTIFLGPIAQRILLPYLLRPQDAYCFSPQESDRKRRQRLHENRKTPISCGNRPNSNRKVYPRRAPGEKYDRNSYGRAIRRAAQKAGVPEWSPHRLRHSFATEVRKRFGLEAVQVTLGHARASTSEIYAERDQLLAARVAGEVG
jgi:integrase